MLPGLFVRVRIPVQKLDNALLVADDGDRHEPASASTCWCVGKDNAVEQRPVKVGQLGRRACGSSSPGSSADDWVVTGGIQRAIPGNKVDPEQAARWRLPAKGG